MDALHHIACCWKVQSLSPCYLCTLSESFVNYIIFRESAVNDNCHFVPKYSMKMHNQFIWSHVDLISVCRKIATPKTFCTSQPLSDHSSTWLLRRVALFFTEIITIFSQTSEHTFGLTSNGIVISLRRSIKFWACSIGTCRVVYKQPIMYVRHKNFNLAHIFWSINVR